MQRSGPSSTSIGVLRKARCIDFVLECRMFMDMSIRYCLQDIVFITFIKQYDLIFCSETWQTSRDSFDPSGYECYDVPPLSSLSTNRRNRGHGGICLFVQNELPKGEQILEKNSDGFLWVHAQPD